MRLLQTRLFQKAFAVLCFTFIVHCPYVAVEAALLRLMDSLATNGELSGAHCRVSLPFCMYRAAFPLDNEELQVVTALGSSLWKA